MNKSFYPLVLLALSGIAYGTQPTLTTNRLSNAVVSTNGAPLTFNLSRYFNTPATTNMVRVITSLTDSKTNPLGFTLQLYPTNAPKTVANFLAYVNDGAYENMLIHRSVPNFIIQTGGYTNGGNTNNWNTPIATWTNIVPCEYGISNLRGTVAMALVGTDSNSATDQWFVNLANNSSTLDATNTVKIPLYGTNGTINFVPNPPFTVFAQVIGNGMQVVDAIAQLPTIDLGAGFETLPLLSNAATIANLITIKRVATLPYFSLSSDPNSYATQVNGTNLTVTYVGGTTPPSNPVTISVFAYDTNGLTTNSSFQVWYKTNAVRTIDYPQYLNQYYSPNGFNMAFYPYSSDGTPIPVNNIYWTDSSDDHICADSKPDLQHQPIRPYQSAHLFIGSSCQHFHQTRKSDERSEQQVLHDGSGPSDLSRQPIGNKRLFGRPSNQQYIHDQPGPTNHHFPNNVESGSSRVAIAVESHRIFGIAGHLQSYF
ncbi:MAG: peptidylprolyl isomerase [Verrucomicrobia bacterium]|nr:peptidylprolyl isomerase [Verrucomicrobiota bacterium]